MLVELALTNSLAVTTYSTRLLSGVGARKTIKYLVFRTESAIVAGKVASFLLYHNGASGFVDLIYLYRPPSYNAWWGYWAEKEVNLPLREDVYLQLSLDAGFHNPVAVTYLDIYINEVE